jgi:Raf kinase inhibitor-like YbhB/YbcL family protein
VSSPAFAPKARIPARFTCDGVDLSPPVQWTAAPAGTREVVLSMVDLDAPQAPFVHWAVAGLAPPAHGVVAGASPPGSVPGSNSVGTIGYRGPCPPGGDRPHRYRIEVVALNRGTGVQRGFSLSALHATLSAHTLGRGTLVAIYSR